MKLFTKIGVLSLLGIAIASNSVAFANSTVKAKEDKGLTNLVSTLKTAQTATEEFESGKIEWDISEITEPKILPRYTSITEYEPNNTSTQAYNSGNRIMPNRWKSGTLDLVSDNVDFYYFENESYGYVNFSVFNVQPKTGMRVDIYNSNMEYQGGANITSSLGVQLSSNSLPIGRYYMKVSISGISTGSYRVSVDKR